MRNNAVWESLQGVEHSGDIGTWFYNRSQRVAFKDTDWAGPVKYGIQWRFKDAVFNIIVPDSVAKILDLPSDCHSQEELWLLHAPIYVYHLKKARRMYIWLKKKTDSVAG